jgi:hypothetical protein
MATIEATGAETGQYLSHANTGVFLQNGVQGAGELWTVEQQPEGYFALACAGDQNGMYLSHAYSSVSLQYGVQGAGEEFYMQMLDDGNVHFVIFGCLGEEYGQYLSHANNSVSLQNGQGTSEQWTLLGWDDASASPRK